MTLARRNSPAHALHAALAVLPLMAAAVQATPLQLALPTPNKALLEGGPDYYMYVNRTFQGRSYTPWQGGQFGFVRTPVMVDGKKVFRKFHEGIDVKPLRRDDAGNPIDPIFAIDEGTVRHVNEVPGRSNYGKYIVIEHRWSNSPVYSLYAHLSQCGVSPGRKVGRGEKIGVMGYTGSGLDRSRGHLHLEIGLLFNYNFERWHQAYFKGAPNHHGIFNGLNLFGMDVAALYQAVKDDANTTIESFVQSRDWFFKVRLPAAPSFQLPHRYPWLVEGEEVSQPNSWEVAFTANALPVSIIPSNAPCEKPKLISVKNSPVPYHYVSRGLISGSQGSASLSNTGLRTMYLLLVP